MKLIFTLIFFLIFSNICLSQSFTMNQGGIMTKNYYIELPFNEKIDLNEKFWPFEPIVTGQKLAVGLVWDNGVNIIKSGEQILAVNDERFSNVDLCDMLNRKPILADRDSAIITLKDSLGLERRVKIIKK